jgi:hypothetical protein
VIEITIYEVFMLLLFFQAVHGRQLDYREHGYLSVIDFLSAMPDTVGTIRPNPRGDWMVYDARLPEPGQKGKNSKKKLM